MGTPDRQQSAAQAAPAEPPWRPFRTVFLRQNEWATAKTWRQHLAEVLIHWLWAGLWWGGALAIVLMLSERVRPVLDAYLRPH